MINRATAAACLAGLASLSIGGCKPAPTKPQSAQAPESVQAVTPALPVSINAVMVAMVDHASEPLWVDAYKPPKTDAEWREAEYNAYQMAVVGKLIQLIGTGPNDRKWVADPDWKEDAEAMSAAGVEALRATQAKDVTSLAAAGDKLVEACEACHKKFKPSLTSMGIYKSPDYPAKK